MLYSNLNLYLHKIKCFQKKNLKTIGYSHKITIKNKLLKSILNNQLSSVTVNNKDYNLLVIDIIFI